MPDPEERQAFAAKLGFSETVFVHDPERGVVDIYTPTLRLPFAGIRVGVGRRLHIPELVTPAGVVGVRLDGEFSWIEARAEWAPGRTLRQYGSADEVDALAVPEPGEWVYAWAWEDELAAVPAPGFPGRDDGIVEDEATGAAVLLLTDRLGRALNIVQGALRSSPRRAGGGGGGGRPRTDGPNLNAQGVWAQPPGMGRRKSSGAGSGGEGELLAQGVEDRRVEGERPPALGDDPLPLQMLADPSSNSRGHTPA